ncbi:MAG: hypothetical protein NC543_05865 [bacterium]|nr:hypothetical protein [bacterium]MCM1374495.1 hypothetical protein [Muribaculum sp.]
MPLEKLLDQRNKALQKKISLEMERVRDGQSSKDMGQLQTILEELRSSSEKRTAELCYPRIIIDSWDYLDKLGIELMELAELYGMVKGPAQ